MKLALLFMLCLLASAFDIARARPQDDGLGEEGGLPEGEDDGTEDGGSVEDDGLGDGGDDGSEGPYDDGDENGPDDEGADLTGIKGTGAAGHGSGGHHRRHHSHHHHRSHHHNRHHGFRGFGGFRRRHHHFGHGGATVDRSTCSVQASYFLSYNGDRRHCRFATEEHDDCQACCEAATRRETLGADKDDIIGFVTLNLRYRERSKRETGVAYDGNDKGRDKDYKPPVHEQKWECVCCIPKAHRG